MITETTGKEGNTAFYFFKFSKFAETDYVHLEGISRKFK